MMRVSAQFTLMLLSVFPAAQKAQSQQYVLPVPQCVREFYDPKLYNWISYENTCTDEIHVALVGISKPHSGALDIRPGGHASPGMTANEVKAVGGLRTYACPANYYAVDTDDKTLINAVVDHYKCKSITDFHSGRRPSSLVYSACDPLPDYTEQGCNVKKLECNKNSYDWCEVKFGKEGTQQNRINKVKYDGCVASYLTDCASSQAQCVAKIRRCPSGQTCSTKTETCVAATR